MLNLKRIRKEKGYSQEKVAHAIGVARSTIAMWEKGASQPDHNSLKALADFFDVTTDFLLEREAKTKGIKIPVLGVISAGVPIEAIQDIIDY